MPHFEFRSTFTPCCLFLIFLVFFFFCLLWRLWCRTHCLIFPVVAIKSCTGFLLEPHTMKVFSLPDVFLERGKKWIPNWYSWNKHEGLGWQAQIQSWFFQRHYSSFLTSVMWFPSLPWFLPSAIALSVSAYGLWNSWSCKYPDNFHPALDKKGWQCCRNQLVAIGLTTMENL